MLKTAFLSFLFCLICLLAKTQDSTFVISAIDTTMATDIAKMSADSTKKRPLRNFLKKKNGLPNPNASLALSLVIPGAGQVYNGKWWKVPIIYGALGGLAYGINFQSENYILLRDAYKRKQRDLPHYFTATRFDNASVLKSERDKYDKNRQLLYAATVVAWLVNGVEAFTDAHLMNFDVSDDLGLRLQPHIDSNQAFGTQSGLSVVLYLK